MTKEELALQCAQYIWDGSCEHENYQEFIEEGHDPRDHVLYAAGCTLGHEAAFAEEIAAYELAKKEASKKAERQDTPQCNLVIQFSGWCKLAAEDVRFELVTTEDNPPTITGVEWLALNSEQQEEYVLRSVSEVIEVSHDGEYDTLDISLEEPEILGEDLNP